MTIDFLYNIATDLLNSATSAITIAGLDAPERTYVETCNVTAPITYDGDCTNQLTVHVGSLAPSRTVAARQATAAKKGCGMLWQAPFTITHLRCYPIGVDDVIPSPYDADQLAKNHLAFGWQFARHLLWMWSQGTLTPSVPLGCDETIWGSMNCIAPRGGIMGWSIPITFSLADIYDGNGV